MFVERYNNSPFAWGLINYKYARLLFSTVVFESSICKLGHWISSSGNAPIFFPSSFAPSEYVGSDNAVERYAEFLVSCGENDSPKASNISNANVIDKPTSHGMPRFWRQF